MSTAMELRQKGSERTFFMHELRVPAVSLAVPCQPFWSPDSAGTATAGWGRAIYSFLHIQNGLLHLITHADDIFQGGTMIGLNVGRPD